MTADFSRLPYDLLATISNRITNEIEEINRVTLDVTSKPPGTMSGSDGEPSELYVYVSWRSVSEEKSAASAESPMREADQPENPTSADSPVSGASAGSPDSGGSRTARQALKSPSGPGSADSPTEVNTTAPVLSWVESLGTGTENDTMLRFTPASTAIPIDLTEANASGMMQLLGGRRTRLSTLLNEPTAFQVGAQAASNIRAKIREMREERGIEVGCLAAGIASWTEATVPARRRSPHR